MEVEPYEVAAIACGYRVQGGHSDARHPRPGAADLVQADERFIEAMLDDDRLFERLISGEEILLRVSPALLFAVLLRRARRDLQRETFTVERRQRQKVVLFDSDRVTDLLKQPEVRDYLTAMLASFTRVRSTTVPVRVRRGVWRKIRLSDLDVDSLMRFSATLDEGQRYALYRQIGDACLFLAGVFPEYIEARQRTVPGGPLRVRAPGGLCQTLEDYEAYGRAFYRLAAEHEQARAEGLAQVLGTLSEEFILAEKPLTFLATRYLGLAKQRLFAV